MNHRPSSAERPKTPQRWLTLGVLVFFFAVGKYSFAQESSHSQTGAPPASSPSTQSDAKKTPDAAAASAPAAVSNDPQQAQLIADTQKLVKLTQELKAELAKSNKDTLSLTAIKKADEVEKLAKSLKEEMSKSH